MRPLIVELGKDFRGGQHQALLLLQGLAKRGHAPELIVLRGSQLARRAKSAGISVHEIAAFSRRFGAAFKIRSLVRGGRVDVVHANEPHALSAAWLARAHRSVPVVVSRRIALPLGSGSASRARYQSAARIVAVSQFVRRSVVASGLSSDEIEVIYDGVEIPPDSFRDNREKVRSQFKVPPETFCIGNAAAFVPEKGHALLLHAFAELRSRFQRESQGRPKRKNPICVLLLRGDGPGKPGLQKLARELQISSDVHFLPPDTDLAALFAGIDLFAFSSHAEPLGSALLAAMAHGVPCVAMAAGGVPEIISDMETGLLVHGDEPGAFAAGIARLQTDPEYARKIGIAARNAIAARFSADHMVEATLRLYEEVASH
jgi:glycosyltransferase involved in cell wall biosynthesis